MGAIPTEPPVNVFHLGEYNSFRTAISVSGISMKQAATALYGLAAAAPSLESMGAESPSVEPTPRIQRDPLPSEVKRSIRFDDD